MPISPDSMRTLFERDRVIPMKLLSSCCRGIRAERVSRTEAKKQEVNNPMKEEHTNLKVATLAGGCFWCVASDFEKVPGVTKIISGYTGGQKENPTYEQVSTGKTGHYEAIQV